jgi:hypothetical protein
MALRIGRQYVFATHHADGTLTTSMVEQNLTRTAHSA